MVPFFNDQAETDVRRLRSDAIMEWVFRIENAILEPEPVLFKLVEEALRKYPAAGSILSVATIAALYHGKTELALRHIKYQNKLFIPNAATRACQAVALAMDGRWPIAQGLVIEHGLTRLRANHLFPQQISGWGKDWLNKIARWKPVDTSKKTPGDKPSRAASTPTDPTIQPTVTGSTPLPGIPPLLDRYTFAVPVTYRLPSLEDCQAISQAPPASPGDCLLALDYAQLSLVKGFDELLCLDQLHGVDSYWYQIETVRKVLKQFRGRVLLADEVGLGKTIEAGMILKEYLLRGMADRLLILTPPSLVGQWEEELRTKFGIEFATSHDALFRDDPKTFWEQPRIIASLSAARTTRHFDLVTSLPWDLVVVDEAHHLKDRRTRNWQVVDALQKRFLLLLSATPVQNNLIELYNLLTLLKPGLFKTESDFKASYVTPRQPRSPINRDRLRELMRDVMIRNTRALVDVKLPPRHAMTIRVEPEADEQACYAALSEAIRGQCRTPEAPHHRMALHHLLQAAGSSPAAATASLARMAKGACPGDWTSLHERYAAIQSSAKVKALLELLGKNPTEKKMIFARYTATLDMLAETLTTANIPFSRFDGHISGPQKDAAIVEFREQTPVLLCSEAGGEGRNVQFCNTLINFDLHWNPQAIEQRIGRVHRIGQLREVFVFNFATRHTLEERLLAILDEKINMFELVVGEIQAILGEMDEDHDFSELLFSAWISETDAHRDDAFAALETRLLDARTRYQEVKTYDENLFGEEFSTQ